MVLEVCVDSVESAVAAQKGGAAREELCADLDRGGTTPSGGMIESVKKSISIDLHVMIRPRPGNFCYTASEFEVMKEDIRLAKRLGADGVVVGLLTRSRTVDVLRTKMLVDTARPMHVTFHRAFDESTELQRSMEEIIGLGIGRILTSGGRPTALEGAANIKDLTDRSNGRIVIMAGGGITLRNAREIVSRTGVREIHVRSAVTRKSDSHEERESLFGTSPPVVDAGAVRDLLRTLS